MIIPNAEHAFIDMRKLRDYTLNQNHRVGRHKARLFASILGITQADAQALKDILLDVICKQNVVLGDTDIHGQRYELDFVLEWADKRALVRSVWQIRRHEEYPRLVTCYPLKERST